MRRWSAAASRKSHSRRHRPDGHSPRVASSAASSTFGSSCGVGGGWAAANPYVASTACPAACTRSSGKTSTRPRSRPAALVRLGLRSRITSRTLNSSRQRLPSRETHASSSVPISVHLAASVTGTRFVPARLPPRSTVCSGGNRSSEAGDRCSTSPGLSSARASTPSKAKTNTRGPGRPRLTISAIRPLRPTSSRRRRRRCAPPSPGWRRRPPNPRERPARCPTRSTFARIVLRAVRKARSRAPRRRSPRSP